MSFKVIIAVPPSDGVPRQSHRTGHSASINGRHKNGFHRLATAEGSPKPVLSISRSTSMLASATAVETWSHNRSVRSLPGRILRYQRLAVETSAAPTEICPCRVAFWRQDARMVVEAISTLLLTPVRRLGSRLRRGSRLVWVMRYCLIRPVASLMRILSDYSLSLTDGLIR
jgi:hypothetical protein